MTEQISTEVLPARNTEAAGPLNDPWPERLRTSAGAELVFRRKVGRDQARYGWADERDPSGMTVLRRDGEGPNKRFLLAASA